MKRNLTAILLSLALACVLLLSACGSAAGNSTTTANAGATLTSSAAISEGVRDVGQGDTVFPFEIQFKDGTAERFNVHTDKRTVGAALLELEGYVKGDNGVIHTVNGHKLDYNTDHAFWEFRTDGVATFIGAEEVEIKAGEKYAFVYTESTF